MVKGMACFVGVILVYKSGLAFLLTATTKKLVKIIKIFTLVLNELHRHVLHQIREEFHNKSNSHNPVNVPHVCHNAINLFQASQ